MWGVACVCFRALWLRVKRFSTAPSRAGASGVPQFEASEHTMSRAGGHKTITKKELIDRIAEATGQKRHDVKKTVQVFLNEIILEIRHGNRLEFRDFGVFEIRERKGRTAQNPRTLEPVSVPPRKVVKFKVGRLMQMSLEDPDRAAAEIEAGDRDE
ncbi:MAG: integration host factor subunit beta [Planctomycetes bacterium]|nr:integration host factor subunit beta [Planctomycetota bacterium]